jgi:hypothetical protein
VSREVFDGPSKASLAVTCKQSSEFLVGSSHVDEFHLFVQLWQVEVRRVDVAILGSFQGTRFSFFARKSQFQSCAREVI